LIVSPNGVYPEWLPLLALNRVCSLVVNAPSKKVMKGNLLRLLLSDIPRILKEDEAFFRNICGE